MACEEKLRAGCVQGGGENAKGDLTAVCSYLMSQTHRDLPAAKVNPPQRCTVEGQEVTGTKLQEGKFQLYIKKSFFTTVTVKYCCPRCCPEKNWNLPPWRHSELN